MLARPGGRKWRPLTTAAVTVYAIFLIASPFEHHDLQCHLRTPLHCTSCAGTALGSNLHSIDIAGVWHLADAGSAPPQVVVARAFLLTVQSSGRAPPSLS
jgi:hypothetical protein